MNTVSILGKNKVIHPDFIVKDDNGINYRDTYERVVDVFLPNVQTYQEVRLDNVFPTDSFYPLYFNFLQKSLDDNQFRKRMMGLMKDEKDTWFFNELITPILPNTSGNSEASTISGYDINGRKVNNICYDCVIKSVTNGIDLPTSFVQMKKGELNLMLDYLSKKNTLFYGMPKYKRDILVRNYQGELSVVGKLFRDIQTGADADERNKIEEINKLISFYKII